MTIAIFRGMDRVSVICDSCFCDITNFKKIRCIDCKEDECIGCFLFNLENSVHELHFFRIIEPFRSNKNSEEWTIIEEYLLFEGLKICGIGNWEDLSLFISTSKEEEKVENHFCELFSLERCSQNPKKPIVFSSNPNSDSLWCYMPLRGDFDLHFRDDFERIIKDIRIENIDMLDFKLNIQMLEIYRNIVAIRRYRESFLIKRKIVDVKKLKEKERTYGDTRMSLLTRLKPLALYLSKDDFNTLFNGLYIESRLRSLIGKKKYILTKKEIQFCTKIGLRPELFTKIRRYFIHLALKNNHIVIRDLVSHIGEKNIDIEAILRFFVGISSKD